MKPEVKYRLIEKLIQTKDDAILSQVEEILDASNTLDDDLKQELDRRMAKYEQGKSKLYSWEEVKERARRSK